jgi:tetratricopeptide (TPR) repeat protein
MDFATDDKVAKRAAREMLKLVLQIRQSVDKLPGREPDPRPAVTCYTCHRGMSEPPRNLRSVLEETAEAEGAPAALARYKSLRDEHYGKGRYDFSALSLNAFARAMLEKKRPDDARRALELNREYYPDSAAVEAAFGQLYLATGDKEKARAAFRHALELDPQEGSARFGLQQLDAPKPRQD